MKIALIRNGIVANVILGEMAFAQTLGYDATVDVTGLRVAPGYLWNGSAFSAPPPDPLAVNAATIEDELQQLIQRARSFRALPKPRSAQQRDNFDDEMALFAIRVCRRMLGQFDGTE